MRRQLMLLLGLTPLILALGCSAFWSNSGRTKVLVPLKRPVVGTASCLIGNIAPPKTSAPLPRSWRNTFRGQLAESLEGKQIFASVKSQSEDTARYLITGALLDFDWLTWTEQTDLREKTRYRRTYDREVKAPVAIAEFTLRDMQDGKVVFKMRLKSQGTKNDVAAVAFSGCARQFATSLDEAVKKRRGVDE